ncbi:zinc-binding dehydrogenase [Paenibacillus sp. EPM92]|uniref:zinc-binding dehydrogenase n=1 Tax=Paenibacillus sp. EPM92 TaxID=1561195 RepID=UPI002804306B|nr:zinc-binding dehydrogenase [Paenibacillus sp. EPM92]
MMKALVLEGAKNLILRQVEDPKPAEDGVLLKVMANGVCRSDHHFWESGLVPVNILGHEFSGVVEEVGSKVTRFKKGDRVTVPFSGSEGSCPHCVSGHSHLCDSLLMPGLTYQGGYAEYVAVPVADRNMIHLPEEISFAEASALGCRFITAFHGIVDRVQVLPGEWVVVYGCGGVGLSAVNIASAMGANVIGVDINDANLDLAKQMGAAYTVNSRTTDPIAAVNEMTQGGADVSVDALGLSQTAVSAIRSLRKRGRHLQIGMTSKQDAGAIAIPVDEMILKELSFITSFGMPAHRYHAVLPLVSNGKLTPGKMVTREVSLSEVNGIFEEMSSFTNTGTYVVTKFG